MLTLSEISQRLRDGSEEFDRLALADLIDAEPEAPVEEASVDTDFIPLREKAVRKDGTAEIKIIKPGWGSSGYYGKAMLQRDGPQVFKAGTKMYWDHPTNTEEAERPERSLRDLAAQLTSDAEWKDRGPEGAGLYAKAKIFDAFIPAIEQLAPHIGVSIRGTGKAKEATAEGRKGPVIEQLVAARSVDFVTEPGAGGQIVQLFESARERQAPPPGGNEVDEKEAKELRDAVAALKAQVDEATGKLTEASAENAKLKERALLQDAAVIVVAELKGTALPVITQERLKGTLIANVPVKEGALDEDALKERVKAAVTDETAYIEKLTGGPIRGMNSTPTDENYDEAKHTEELTGTFTRLGLSEAASKVAATGRV